MRVQARNDRSRSVLRRAKSRGFAIETGLMLGLGERREEIEQMMRDLIGDEVNILTIGQYLQPTVRHLPVDRWVAPEEFQHWTVIFRFPNPPRTESRLWRIGRDRAT